MNVTSSKRDLGFFQEVKKACHGLMPAKTYAEYYKVATEQSQANIIDVGVARGGSSIAFATGLLDSGKRAKVHAIDIFWQPAADGPHKYNTTEHPDRRDCIARNLEEVRINARRFGVEHLIELWDGPATEVASRFPADLPVDVLTVDVDGQIDIHMPPFYDMIPAGGMIILDDYGDFIDKRGLALIEQFRGKSETDVRAWLDATNPTKKRRLVGKHMLTFRLAAYLEEIGALKREHVVEVTVFCTKPADRKFSSYDLSGINEINKSIEDEFVYQCCYA
jgi:hypothetical protein